MTNIVPAAPQRRQRRRRGIVPKGGRAALSPKKLELHAQLVVDGCFKSGRGGGYDFYVVNGKQRWRRHAAPKAPRTPAQQRSRARFAAASKPWSEDCLLTEALREAWYADGAKSRSRSRLGQSGPLTGQQDFIGCNCTRKQRGCEMLMHPHQREQHKVKSKGHELGFTAEVSQFQLFTRLTSGTRQALTGYAPSIRRACRGYARKCDVRQ